MNVVIDSSIWMDYFRSGKHAAIVDDLIDANQATTNELILAELVPFLRLQRQNRLIKLMQALSTCPLQIDWQNLIDMQVKCLRHGINRVGIPDLIIAQNVMNQNAVLLTKDKHFRLIAQHLPLHLYGE